MPLMFPWRRACEKCFCPREFSYVFEESALRSEDTRVFTHIDQFVFVNVDKTARMYRALYALSPVFAKPCVVLCMLA